MLSLCLTVAPFEGIWIMMPTFVLAIALINVLHASHRPWYLKVRLRNVQKGQQSQVERSQHGQHPAEREEQPGPRVGLRAHRASLVVERAPRSP